MNRTFLTLFLLSFFISTYAQDKKLMRLYNHEQYCDCIERFNKLSYEKKTTDALFIAASSYYQLFKTPDIGCKIKDPLPKCFKTLERIKKSKSTGVVQGLPELVDNAVSAATETYRDAMYRHKWDAALILIERIKKIQYNSSLLIDQATCEYGIAKLTAFETACYALNFYANNPDEKDKVYFFDQTYPPH